MSQMGLSAMIARNILPEGAMTLSIQMEPTRDYVSDVPLLAPHESFVPESHFAYHRDVLLIPQLHAQMTYGRQLEWFNRMESISAPASGAELVALREQHPWLTLICRKIIASGAIRCQGASLQALMFSNHEIYEDLFLDHMPMGTEFFLYRLKGT